MTLVVGIHCPDGVVIGTDSAMTFGVVRSPTVVQPFHRKIDIIDEKIIVAGTGEIGLGQRFVDVIAQQWGNKGLTHTENVQGHKSTKNIFGIGREISNSVMKDFVETAANLNGEVNYGALVAIPYKNKAQLIEFTPGTLQPEVKTPDNWYVSMGSGQPVADPLLGFARRVLWGDKPPELKDAIFAATMILELACEMAPTGVAKPIQLATLAPTSERGRELSAHLLSRDELDELRGHVEQVVEHFRDYPKELAPASATQEQLPQAPDASST